MFKKFMSFFVSVCMLLAFMPMRSQAVDSYPLQIDGNQVTSENLSGTGWSYQGNASSGTLTLENANISSISSNSGDNEYSLTINLVGESTVSGKIIFNKSSLTIQGEGTLNANSEIFVHGADLTITGDCTVNSVVDSEEPSPVIYVSNIVTSPYGLTISGNSHVNAINNYSDFHDDVAFMAPIVLTGGPLTIKDNSYVNSSGGSGIFTGGNYSSTGLTITDNSTVITNGSNGYGIALELSNFTISGNSSVEATGGSGGIIIMNPNSSPYYTKIKDNSSVTATGTGRPTGDEFSAIGGCGLVCTNDITLSDDISVTAQGQDYAIRTFTNDENQEGIILEQNEAGKGPQILVPENGKIRKYVETVDNESRTTSTVCNSNDTTATRAVIGKNFDINVQSSPPSYDCGTVSGGGTYLSATDVTVTATPGNHYRFVNWTENGAQVSTDANYSFRTNKNRDLTANFEPETYTIKFVNDDGTELQSSSVAYGSTPNYTGATPTKPSDNQHTYTFAGWSPAITSVTGDKTYTATYTTGTNQHTINISANPTAGGTVSGGGTYDYGTQINLSATPNEHYNFINWTENGQVVSTDASYSFSSEQDRDLVANFEPETYTIKFVNGDGTVLQSSSVAYGVTPEYTGATPTKPADARYTYTFKGWSPDITSVTENKTYTATYNSTVNEYTITFRNEDGTELQSGSVAYGTTPEYTGETPTKESDDQYTYTFSGWNPEIVPVTDDATYTAVYSGEARTDNSESEGDPDDVTPIDGDDEEDPGYYDDNEDPTYYDDGENPTEAETSLAESPAEAENKESVASDGTMYAPITGDETNFILWVVLIAISIFWLTFVMVFRNKHSLILKTMSGGPR